MFPEMPVESIRMVDFGWTNQILVLDRRYVVKIPRFPEAARWVEKEIELTRELRGTIPVRIPAYVGTLYNGNLVAAAYDFLEGSLFTTQPVDEGVDKVEPANYLVGDLGQDIAGQIGSILSSIHNVPLARVEKILERHVESDWDTKIINWISQCKKTAERVFQGQLRDRCVGFLSSIETEFSGFGFKQKFIHGDFGGWNMLFSPEQARLTGLLDWADARLGDPAKDFTELIYDFGRGFAEKVLDQYGRDGDPEIISRAELYLKLNGFQDLEFGLEKKSEFFTERGKRAILAELEKI